MLFSADFSAEVTLRSQVYFTDTHMRAYVQW